MYLKPQETVSSSIEITLDIDGESMSLESDPSLGNISKGVIENSRVIPDKNESDDSKNAAWTIEVTQEDMSEHGDQIEDLYILFYYSVST